MVHQNSNFDYLYGGKSSNQANSIIYMINYVKLCVEDYVCVAWIGYCLLNVYQETSPLSFFGIGMTLPID
jgi:hypothetical protein